MFAGVLFALPAAGATVNAPGVLTTSKNDSPAVVSGGVPVLPDAAAIAVSGDAKGAERSEDGGTVSVVLTGEDTDAGEEVRTKRTAMISVTEDVDLSEWDALTTEVYLVPSVGKQFPTALLTVSLYTDGDVLRFRSDLSAGSVKTVTFDLGRLAARSAVRRITATLEWENFGENPGKIVFSRLCGATAGTAPNGAMSSLSLSSGKGKMTVSGNGVTLTPSDGVAELFSRIDPEALPKAEVDDGTLPVRYAALTLSADGGSVSAELNGTSEAETVSAAKRQIFPGEHVYLFRFVSEAADTVKFTFQSPDGGQVKCKSLEFFVTGSHDPTVDSAGCVIECTVKDGSLAVEGKLKKSAAVEYVGEELGLFTVPAAGGETVMLARGRAGSVFSFSVPLSSLPREGRENYFWVSVLGDGGDVPITEKKFLSSVPPAEGNASVSGLYGAEPAGVFEAGMNRAVVDVKLDGMIGGERSLATGLSAIRDAETYYLNDEYVRSLDAEMEFYEASGIGVYLRFTVDDPAAWFGDGEKDDPDDERGLDLYLALTSFFCGRYRNVSSIVIPDVRGDGDLWEDAVRAALLARLTYAAATAEYDSFTVTVPVAGLGDGKDGETFAAFVAESLYQIGQIPWSLLTETEKSDFNGLDVPITTSGANGTAYPSFSALLWTPTDKTADEAAAVFLDLCAASREAGSRAVILSIPSLTGSRFIDYSILRGSGGGDGAQARGTVDFSAVEPLVTNSSVLWDFRDSYSTEGWAAGSGIGSFGTEFYSGRSGDRVLSATLDAESSHGIILRTFPEEINFSKFPLIEFDLAVSSEDGAVVTFMFGVDGGDAEYVLGCPPDTGRRRVVCDLSDLPGSGGIKYFSVLIRSEGTATADVFGITAHSKTETQGSIAIDGRSADGQAPKKEFDKRIYFIAAGAAIVLIPLGIHLFRSDRDASFAKARRLRELEKKAEKERYLK